MAKFVHLFCPYLFSYLREIYLISVVRSGPEVARLRDLDDDLRHLAVVLVVRVRVAAALAPVPGALATVSLRSPSHALLAAQ
jgi:hypothetical protein